MGQEIGTERFRSEDYERFRRRLAAEEGLLRDWLRGGTFASGDWVAGFELEAWLVGPDQRPVPRNEEFLARVGPDYATYELSRFNVELNTTPTVLRGAALDDLSRDLRHRWQHCREAAEALGAGLLMIGILPTVRQSDLGLDSMSPQHRYRALNEQILRLRHQQPLHIDIRGYDHLHVDHRNLMLEAATTSFQIHLQVPLERALRVYNIALMVSGPMVAVSANSPYLFGHDLWAESRIPLFEQAVDSRDRVARACRPNRVGFGEGYLRESIWELFARNRDDYEVLLPTVLDEETERLPHLRLHNGTIWRWNRPLVGFDGAGRPHLRIEHRVVPAGPTLTDMLANAALFFGLAAGLAGDEHAGLLGFAQARANFYRAARRGLAAELDWLDGRRYGAAALLQRRLLPLARKGLARLGLAHGDIEALFQVLEGRIGNGQTGSVWQRRWVERHGADPLGLVAAYRQHQDSGDPVHLWSV